MSVSRLMVTVRLKVIVYAPTTIHVSATPFARMKDLHDRGLIWNSEDMIELSGGSEYNDITE